MRSNRRSTSIRSRLSLLARDMGAARAITVLTVAGEVVERSEFEQM
jgi:hypothetical protein